MLRKEKSNLASQLSESIYGFFEIKCNHKSRYLFHFGVFHVIIQQIVTLSKYGHDALDICHP